MKQINNNKLKLTVLFYSTAGCSTCLDMWDKLLESLEEVDVSAFTIIKRTKEDLKDNNPYNITDFPTIVVSDGSTIRYNKIIGLKPKSTIKNIIKTMDELIRKINNHGEENTEV